MGLALGHRCLYGVHCEVSQHWIHKGMVIDILQCQDGRSFCSRHDWLLRRVWPVDASRHQAWINHGKWCLEGVIWRCQLTCVYQNQFLKHFYARAFCLIFVPVVIYLFWFYVHFAILIESGPGDAFMTTRFQDTLQNSPLKLSALGECTIS